MKGERPGRVRIVVPAYDEAASLGAVLRELGRSVPHEVLVVDDGSTDGTAAVARAAGVRCLSLPCNLGYGGAVQAGLEAALDDGCDVVVLFDADGQHPADAVDRVLAPVLAGAVDVAIGSRYSDGRPYVGPLGRRLGQRLFSGLTPLFTGYFEPVLRGSRLAPRPSLPGRGAGLAGASSALAIKRTISSRTARPVSASVRM